VASSLDEHLGRGIRHDDVYEELAPTKYCKTNKKRTLTVPRSQKKQGKITVICIMVCSSGISQHQPNMGMG